MHKNSLYNKHPGLLTGPGCFYNKILRSIKGFTLIELLVAIIIIGSLVAFTIPKYTQTMEKTKTGEAIAILSALRQAQSVYEFETGGYTDDINNLDVTVPASANFNNVTVDTADPIATVDRNSADFDYTLGINANGDICCDPTTPASICDTIGYSTGC